MGRWSWLQIDGKNNHRTRILTAYRPYRPSNDSGLTTIWDQQMRYIRKHSLHLDPRQQFDYDLKELLLSWINDDIKIILCIDANENALEGRFASMIEEIGLRNMHQHYSNIDLPPTHDRGSVPISGMFGSPTLIPSRVGNLANGSGITGDHRNMFVDFDEEIILGSELHSIRPPNQRRLQLFDSRIIHRFNNACYAHLSANNIPLQVETLVNEAIFPLHQNMIKRWKLLMSSWVAKLRRGTNVVANTRAE